MRKMMSFGALALALAAGTAHAQPPRDGGAPQHQRREQADSAFRGRRGPGGGPEQFLLRGITLTDAQQQRIAALRQQEHQRTDGQRDAGRKAFEEVRALRERGDTAAARAKMAELRTQME